MGGAALAAFTLASLCASGYLFARDAPGPRSPADARIEELRGLLAAGEVLGYVDDGAGGDAETEACYRTQYDLAPALLERGAVHPRVVGRFRAPPSAARLRELGLVVEHDFGDGVLLLRREGP